MSDDFVSLKVLIVCETAAERELLRRATSQASVPIDVVEVERAGSAAATRDMLASEDFDVVFLDARIPKAERDAVMVAIRACKSDPVTVLIGQAEIARREAADGLAVDGVLVRPVTPDDASAALSACIRARGLSRVLVVDDSPTVRSVVCKVLQSSRYRLEAEEADGGAVALASLGRGAFDAVLLDCDMPVMDGWATLAELRSHHPDLAVVMMTGATDTQAVDRARIAGARDLLFKPFYAKDIDAVMNRLFGLMPAKAG